jgi:HSP20 family protein
MRLVRYTYPTFQTPAFNGVRSPWSGLESEIDRLFETAVADLNDSASGAHFPVDIFDDKDHMYLRAELPGLTREDITVEMTDGELAISGTRKNTSEGEAGESVSFSRVISIGEDVDAQKVSAAYEDGVLTVTLPKREEAKPKKITVAVK